MIRSFDGALSPKRALIFRWCKQVREQYPQDFMLYRLLSSVHGVRAVVSAPKSRHGREMLREFLEENFPEVNTAWAVHHPEWMVPYVK